MLKGNVCIELHNHKTGLRDRVEGENAITSGFQDLINTLVSMGANANMYAPLYSTLLGGLMITDSQLSGDDIYVPGDARIIGSGYYGGANTASTMTGSYNSLESNFDESALSYTHVWDFATTQANGTIQGLGLTTKAAGQYPLIEFNQYSTRLYDSSKMIVYIDEENRDVYYLNRSNKKLYKIEKYDFKSLRIDNYINIIPTGIDTGISIEIPQNNFFCDGFDGYVYYFTVSGTTVKIGRIKVDDLSFTVNDEYKTYIFATIIDGGTSIGVDMSNDFFYFGSSSGGCVYRVNNSTGNITRFDLSNFNVSEIGYFTAKEGSLYFLARNPIGSTVNYTGMRINENGDIDYDLQSGITAPSTKLDGYQKGSLISTVNGIYPASQTLLTNYNTQETIQKTNNQSMKVTYTIRMV